MDRANTRANEQPKQAQVKNPFAVAINPALLKIADQTRDEKQIQNSNQSPPNTSSFLNPPPINVRPQTTAIKTSADAILSHSDFYDDGDDDDDDLSGDSSASDISSDSRLRSDFAASALARRRPAAASLAYEIERGTEAVSQDTNALVALMETRRKDKEKEALQDEEAEESNHGNFQAGRIALVCALVVLFFGHLAATIWCFKNPEPYEHPYTCLTPNCKRMGKWLLDAMNESADPCEDFYEYACGGFLAANPSLPLKSNDSLSFTEGIPYVYDGNAKLGIFLRPTTKYPVNQILPFYKSCVFQARRDERGLLPFINLLAKLKLLYPQQAGEATPSVARYVARVFKFTSKLCFLTLSDTTHNFITVGVAETDSEILITNGRTYSAAMFNVFKIFKSALMIEEDEEIETIVWLVMRFEAQLVQIQAKGIIKEVFGFPHRMNSYIKIPKKPHRNFNDKTGTWLWQDFIDELYVRGESEKPVLFFNYIMSLMTHENRFYILVLEQFLKRNSFYTIFRYLQWTLMKNFAFDMTSPVQNEMIKIFRWIGKSRTERCFRSVFTNLNALAAERYTLEFTDFTKTNEQMGKLKRWLVMSMTNISETFLPSSLSFSILDTFATLQIVGATIQELSQYIPTFYRGLNVSEESYFANVIQARKLRARNEILRTRKVYPFSNWPIGAYSLSETTTSFVQEVNVNRRFLHVPFGALYEPFVGNDLPILDVGGFGYYMVGFYMMMYAAKDLLERTAYERKSVEPFADVLFQKKMEAELLPRIDCIYKSYGKLRSKVVPLQPFNPFSAPSRLKNVADVLAFEIINKIVKMYERNQTVFPKYQLLPGMEKFSMNQLLHLSIARESCKTGHPTLVKFLLNQGPTPFELRINGAFRLSPSFGRAWKCPRNSSMNPTNKCEFFKIKFQNVTTDWDSKYFPPKEDPGAG